MEQQINNETNESSRTIFDRWLGSIFEQLDALKKSIFLAREGFSDLNDIISTSEVSLYHIRERNFKYCILLFESLLNDLKTQLKEDFFNEQVRTLKDIKNKVYTNINEFFELSGNKKYKTYYPTRLYYHACDILEQERSKLIEQIKNLLYTQQFKQTRNKQM